jgi:curved DNA-binding protein CbpA
MTYEELQSALKVFELSDRATLQEIKIRHRALVKRFHPDLTPSEPDRIRLVNAAYQILLEYCENYRFSFALDEFFEQNPEERLRRQFSQDPVWGGE